MTIDMSMRNKCRGSMRTPSGRKSGYGFTLIELMITVAVVAILAVIAIPSYSEYVRKSKRAQAKADLLEAAQIAERFRTVNGTYEGLSIGTDEDADEIWPHSPRQGTADYDIEFSEDPGATSFELIATPVGNQAQDRCGVLSINQLGVKRHSTGDDNQCQFGTTAEEE